MKISINYLNVTVIAFNTILLTISILVYSFMGFSTFLNDLQHEIYTVGNVDVIKKRVYLLCWGL